MSLQIVDHNIQVIKRSVLLILTFKSRQNSVVTFSNIKSLNFTDLPEITYRAGVKLTTIYIDVY